MTINLTIVKFIVIARIEIPGQIQRDLVGISSESAAQMRIVVFGPGSP